MKRLLVILALLAVLIVPRPATAQSNTALGIGTGVVAGALVAGPVGAVVGGLAGAAVGSSMPRPRYGAYRPVRRTVHRPSPRHRMSKRRPLQQHQAVAARSSKPLRPVAPEAPKVEPAAAVSGALQGARVEEPGSVEPAHSGSGQSPEPIIESSGPLLVPASASPQWRDPEYR